MDYQTNIPAILIDEGELSDLIARLGTTFGVTPRIEKQFVISTDDGEFSEILDSIALGLESRKPVRKPEDKVRKPRQTKVKSKAMGRASYRIVQSGEIVSTRKLHETMKTNEAVLHQVLENFKGERFVILQDGHNGMMLAKEPQE